MKKIEDIEMMADDELEKIAMDESVPVPQGLRETLEDMLSAQAVSEEIHREAGVLSPRSRRIAGLSMAAAAVIAAFVLLPSKDGELKDTFDDPYLAYAEVEKAFSRISGEMSKAADKTAKAASKMEKPIEIIRKINEK